MSIPGESYEEWLARTAPKQPVRTVNPRTWDWGVIVLLALFFGWILYEGHGQGWIGIGIVVVLAGEAIIHRRLVKAGAIQRDPLLRGVTLLVTLVLSGLLIAAEPHVLAVLPVLLVLLDLKDDRSFLRFAWERGRGRRARSDGPGSQENPGPPPAG